MTKHEHNENGSVTESVVENKTEIIVYGHQQCTCGTVVATYVVSRTQKNPR
jgi:hypothetical protein